jgi:hypothetical protein
MNNSVATYEIPKILEDAITLAQRRKLLWHLSESGEGVAILWIKLRENRGILFTATSKAGEWTTTAKIYTNVEKNYRDSIEIPEALKRIAADF